MKGMSLSKKLALGTLIASSSSARATMYDDFSSGVLDPARWQIRQDPELQPLTEFFGVENGVFRAENFDSADRRTVLALTGHTFVPGETLDYDVNYVSGMGNRALPIFIDNGPLDRSGVGTIPYGGGTIGHNGQDFAAGNNFGLYPVRLHFEPDGLNVTINNPLGSVYDEFFRSTLFGYGGQTHSLFPPYTVGFETWSNGSIRAEFDNFRINEVPNRGGGYVLGVAALASLLRRRKA